MRNTFLLLTLALCTGCSDPLKPAEYVVSRTLGGQGTPLERLTTVAVTGTVAAATISQSSDAASAVAGALILAPTFGMIAGETLGRLDGYRTPSSRSATYPYSGDYMNPPQNMSPMASGMRWNSSNTPNLQKCQRYTRTLFANGERREAMGTICQDQQGRWGFIGQ